MLNITDIKSLDVRHNDGARICSVGVNLCIYIEPPFEEIINNVLEVYDAFLELCPTDKLVWYLTNSMEKHEKVTRSTLDMPRIWLKSEKKNKKLIAFEIKDATSKYYTDTPNWRFSFVSRSRDNSFFEARANYIDILFPCEFLGDRLQDFNDFIAFSFGCIPFLSGHAGYAFEISPYYENKGAVDKALSLSLRYKEIDIVKPDFAIVVKKYNGIKGVNWATIINTNFEKKINRIKKNSFKSLFFKDIEGGVIVRADDRPLVADHNKGEVNEAYCEAYKLLKPLIVKTPCPLKISGEFEERMHKTSQWLHRFACSNE